MMGHPELLSECDINQLEPLLPPDVVNDLLSKYVQTFTVSSAHIETRIQSKWMFSFGHMLVSGPTIEHTANQQH